MNQEVNQEEIARRKKILEDAVNFSKYIPDELRFKLETLLPENAREAVLQLQLLAIKYGRAIERKESGLKSELDPEKKIVLTPQQSEKKVDILVVPANALKN